MPRRPFSGTANVIEHIDPNAVLALPQTKNMLFQVQWQYQEGAGRWTDEFERYLDAEIRPICELARRAAEAFGGHSGMSQGRLRLLSGQSRGQHADTSGRSTTRTTMTARSTKLSSRAMGKPPHWCLSDFFRSDYESVTRRTSRCLQRRHHGPQECQRRRAREWFEADRYRDYLHLHGLALETAEAARRGTFTGRMRDGTGASPITPPADLRAICSPPGYRGIALQLRLPGVSQPRGSREDLAAATAGRHRRRIDRGVATRSRAVHLRPDLPPSRGPLFQRTLVHVQAGLRASDEVRERSPDLLLY